LDTQIRPFEACEIFVLAGQCPAAGYLLQASRKGSELTRGDWNSLTMPRHYVERAQIVNEDMV
jgi:hypothetical protein